MVKLQSGQVEYAKNTMTSSAAIEANFANGQLVKLFIDEHSYNLQSKLVVVEFA